MMAALLHARPNSKPWESPWEHRRSKSVNRYCVVTLFYKVPIMSCTAICLPVLCRYWNSSVRSWKSTPLMKRLLILAVYRSTICTPPARPCGSGYASGPGCPSVLAYRTPRRWPNWPTTPPKSTRLPAVWWISPARPGSGG